MLILNLSNKKIDVQITQKILQQQKLTTILLVDIQFQQFGHLITENKHTLYHGEECMKKFCETLREHTKNIIDFEKKKMLLLNK